MAISHVNDHGRLRDEREVLSPSKNDNAGIGNVPAEDELELWRQLGHAQKKFFYAAFEPDAGPRPLRN